MFKRKLTKDDYLQIAVNLMPLVGVWFLNWDPRMIFLIYVCETIIIGVFNVLKMFLITLVKKQDIWQNNGSSTMMSGYFFIFFFILHYGFFVFVQMFLFFGVSNMHTGASGTVLQMLSNVWKEPTLYAMVSFILMYAIRMINEFILPGKFREVSLARQMFSPYMRIFIQQFVVIIGSFFLTFGAGRIFMLVFVIVKIYFDIFLDFHRILAVYEKKTNIEEEIKKQSPEMQEKLNRMNDLLRK